MKNFHKSSGHNFHILVVEDDELIRDMIKQNVENAGYECTIAESGVDALKILDEGKKNVDVILTDIRMPGLNGIELTMKVKDKHDSDVIVMTGFAEDFTYEKVIESGASDFFQKPINSRELMLRLKRVLKERILFAERNQADAELKQSFEKLRRAQNQTVVALASASEIRDPYTSGHQQRVTKLACSIAENMDLSENLIEGLRIAGLLHDIGKISVPAEILSKPGKITQDEYNIIKQHCQIGYEILKGIEFPWPVAQIVLQHHEKMNGSGYPLGLTGEEILLEARILTVADVIEAMSSHRPYRPGLGIDKALDEVMNNKSTFFDPVVVDTCWDLFSSGKFEFEYETRKAGVRLMSPTLAIVLEQSGAEPGDPLTPAGVRVALGDERPQFLLQPAVMPRHVVVRIEGNQAARGREILSQAPFDIVVADRGVDGRSAS